MEMGTSNIDNYLEAFFFFGMPASVGRNTEVSVTFFNF